MSARVVISFRLAMTLPRWNVAQSQFRPGVRSFEVQCSPFFNMNNSNTTYLELESRPSTPFSLSLTPSLTPSTAPSSRPTTPPLMVETATLYHGQIEDVTNSCYHGGWCYRALRNSLKTRRPGGRLRIRRRKTKH